MKKQFIAVVLFFVASAFLIDLKADTWRVAQEDSVSVCANLIRLNKHGKYYLVDITLYNDSDTPKGFDFKGMRLVTPHHSRAFLPVEKYLKQQKKKGFWKSLFSGIGIWITAFVVDRTINGDNDSFGNEASSLLITEAALVGTDMVMDHYSERFDRIVDESIGYLRNVTIQPGRSLEGFALIPRKKTKGPLTVDIPYAGKIFSFTWEKSALETLQ